MLSARGVTVSENTNSLLTDRKWDVGTGRFRRSSSHSVVLSFSSSNGDTSGSFTHTMRQSSGEVA